MLEVSDRKRRISHPAVRRLSFYLRQLEHFGTHNRKTVSSKQLADALNLTDAQVRKDLASAGQFGHPGIGYRVEDLARSLRQVLGIDRTWNVVLVGAGNLGRALTSYRGFVRKGFQIVAVFDSDPSKTETHIGRYPVFGMNDLTAVVRSHNVRMAILAVPAEAAQAVADQLIAAGVHGILNFAPVALNVPDDVALEAVDLAVQMEQLSYRVTAKRLRPVEEAV